MNQAPTLNIPTHRTARFNGIAKPAGSHGNARLISSAERLLNLHERLLGSAEPDILTDRFRNWVQEQGLGKDIVYSPATAANEKETAPHPCRGKRLAFTLKAGESHLGTLAILCREHPDDDEMIFMTRAVSCLSHYLNVALSMQSYRQLAMHDGLTGLLNRKSLDARLAEEVSRAQRHGGSLSMMLIDVDHFKALNDQLGHLSGDHTLRLLADIFTAVTRESDLVFRYGGDEFAILLPATDLQAARCSADRIRARLESMPPEAFCISGDNAPVRPGVSIGIAQYQQGDTESDLLQRADNGLYEAKARGRGRVCAQV